MRTFIRWQGNKSKHIGKFEKYLPTKYNTYIEPFVGSGALFLNLQPTKWIINDLNTNLITFWTLIRENPQMILNKLAVYEKKFSEIQNRKDKILYARKLLGELETGRNILIKSVILIFLTYHSYMGMISDGKNYRFSGLEMYGLPRKYNENIMKVHQYLFESSGEIYNTNYVDILKMAKKDDFVFLDPPYIEDKDYQFFYNKNQTFNILDLAKQLKRLDRLKVKWLMTQADTMEVRKVFGEYDIHEFKVFRIASQSYKTELVIRNFKS